MQLQRSAGAFVLAVGLVLSACGGADDPVPGELIAAARADQFTADEPARIVVPTGALRIWTGEPTRTLAAEDVRDTAPFEAAPGTSYVPISWSYDTAGFEDLSSYLATDATPSITLHSGDHSYRLPPPSRHASDQSFYVVVDGDAADLALAVDFDGVTQTVDLHTHERDAGRAATLYETKRPKLRKRECRAADWFEKANSATQLNCEVEGPLLLPYANGQWAEPGRHWLVVGLTTGFVAYGELDGPAGAHLLGVGVETTLRLGKREPTAVLRARNVADSCPDRRTRLCGWSGRAVFEVGDNHPSRLRVTQHYDLVVRASWGNYDTSDLSRITGEGVIELD